MVSDISSRNISSNKNIPGGKSDWNKLQVIIKKHSDRVPVHFYLNKKITINATRVNREIDKNYNILKALVPKEMKYQELLMFIRTKYLELNNSKQSIICFCKGKLIPHHLSTNELWDKNDQEYFKPLIIKVESENTFG
tara:strand:+ start:109 stop:522 length:414 start_codon:yes stop_codon:yes gene_type:complete